MSEEVAETTGQIVQESDAQKAANSFGRWLEARAERETSAGFMEEQIGSILMAEDSEAMWDADDTSETESSKAIPDVEMSIDNFTVHRGQTEYGEGLYPFFMIVRAYRLDNGEPIVFSTGAPLIMAKLKWMEDHGELPAQCVIRTAKTAKGYDVLKLRKLTERAVQGRRSKLKEL